MPKRDVCYYPSRALYNRFMIEGKEYQVLPSESYNGTPYEVCQYCKKGFGEGKECPQFICREDVMPCSGEDRKDGTDVYFEWNEENFKEESKKRK